MAVVTTFRARAGTGICVGFLPMPDGTYRTYRGYGGPKTIRQLLTLWRRECVKMRAELSLNFCQSLHAKVGTA